MTVTAPLVGAQASADPDTEMCSCPTGCIDMGCPVAAHRAAGRRPWSLRPMSLGEGMDLARAERDEWNERHRD